MAILSSKELADTYNPSGDRGGWEQVQLFRQTQRYPDDWGGARVASAINGDKDQPFCSLSRSNVRAWVEDGGMPDAARAVKIAEDLGWVGEEWTLITRSLAQLVAGVFACGNIDRSGFRPGWSPSRTYTRSELKIALERCGTGWRYIDRENESKGSEIRPDNQPSALGRALAAAGAPVGDKNATNVIGLPNWLENSPPSVRAGFAELLVSERGSERGNKTTLQIQANRSRQYFEDVRELLEDVTGERVTASDAGVTISADAVRALGLA